jgi:hypothetical protein
VNLMANAFIVARFRETRQRPKPILSPPRGLVVLIFSYRAMHELVGVVGAEKMRELFFGEPSSTRG